MLWIWQLCEAFPGALPTELYREWQRLPPGFLEELLEVRAFASAVQAYQANGGKLENLPPSRLLTMVQEIEFEEAERAMRGASDDDE